jgi:hypothetical protein
MAIIRYDFGKKQRDTVRRFRKLVSLDAAHEARVLANPLPYLERAEQRLFVLEEALRDAAAALAPRQASPATDRTEPETVTIAKTEYDRLTACESIILAAAAKLR